MRPTDTPEDRPGEDDGLHSLVRGRSNFVARNAEDSSAFIAPQSPAGQSLGTGTPTDSTLNGEVTFISGINADGTLALYSFAAWNGDDPATYTGGYTGAIKWFANAGSNTAGTAGGNVTYAFNPASNWTATEQAAFTAGLALWSAVANVTFTLSTDYANAGIDITRGNDGKARTTYAVDSTPSNAGLTDGTKLFQITQATISIDTSVASFGPIGQMNDPGANSIFSNFGGYALQTILHEEGHALGLGHAGPYPVTDGTASDTLQYGAYDNRQWTIMSYIDPTDTSAPFYSQNPAGTANWGTSYTNGSGYNNVSTTWGPLDILAIQRLYGTPVSTPLSGGQVFGFDTNLTGPIAPFFNFLTNRNADVTIWDAGTNNTLNIKNAASVNLNPGTFSSVNGWTNNLFIAYGTKIDTFNGDSLMVIANDDGDTITSSGTIIGGAGNDTITYGTTVNAGGGDDRITAPSTGSSTIDGGSGIDTAAFASNLLAYSIAQNANGTVTVTGLANDTRFLTTTLSNVEFLAFKDQTVLPSYVFDNSGDDTIFATIDDDYIDGGPGINTLSYAGPTSNNVGVNVDLSLTTAQMAAGSGIDIIKNIEILIGSSQVDYLASAANTVAISGGDGNDIIRYYGLGTPVLDGGNGFDVLNLKLQSSTSDIAWAFTPGVSTAQTLPGGATFKNFEHFDLNTGSGNDTIEFDGLNPISYYLVSDKWDGGAGNDTAIVDLSSLTANITAAATFIDYEIVAATGGDGTKLHLYNVENIRLIAGSGTDMLSGDKGNDAFYGGDGDDTLSGGGGNDMLDGGAGIDTAVFSGARAGYTILRAAGTITVSGADGTDTLTGIEKLQFSDTVLQLSLPRTDFNGDGTSDLLWQNDDGQAVVWTVSNANQSGGGAVGGNPGSDWHVRGSGDFDGDGYADILWQNDNGQAAVWTFNGLTQTGGSTVGGNPGADWKIKGSGDFNGDGYADILWQNDNGQAAIWTFNGLTQTGGSTVGGNPGSDWHIKAAADFNGDGKADILWQNDNGQAAIWLMDGLTQTAGSTVGGNPGSDWHIKGAADFDGDGKADILWQNDNGQAAIWTFDGLTQTGGSLVGANPGPTWHTVGAGDYDGDGKADILWQNDNGQAVVWTMSGLTQTGGGAVGGNPGTAWHLVSG